MGFRIIMRRILSLFILNFLFVNAHAEYILGPKYHVENEAADFEVVELWIAKKFVGFIDANSPPFSFSKDFYVYATCPVDKESGKPNGYCINWEIYDVHKELRIPLSLPGLTFASAPSFFWPFIAYVKAPEEITKDDFKNGSVNVSCVVLKWPKKNVIAAQKVKVDVGAFETDVPSFYPPKFTQQGASLEVTCSEYKGPDEKPETVIATMKISSAMDK
jgi:hypothetical protein